MNHFVIEGTEQIISRTFDILFTTTTRKRRDLTRLSAMQGKPRPVIQVIDRFDYFTLDDVVQDFVTDVSCQHIYTRYQFNLAFNLLLSGGYHV